MEVNRKKEGHADQPLLHLSPASDRVREWSFVAVAVATKGSRGLLCAAVVTAAVDLGAYTCD